MIEDAALQARLGEISRTIELIVPESELTLKLDAGRPLRVKLGHRPHVPDACTSATPSSSGSCGHLQDQGHQPVLILGDYTATVGDPSGKDKTRPMLTPAQIEANLATWLDQIGMVLDMDGVEIRRNSEWFAPMTFLDVLGLADRMTVQQMMERDSFENRVGVERADLRARVPLLPDAGLGLRDGEGRRRAGRARTRPSTSWWPVASWRRRGWLRR